MLEPEVKVKIVEGMEIKVGGSTLKFILGWVIFVWRGDESVGLYPFCVEVLWLQFWRFSLLIKPFFQLHCSSIVVFYSNDGNKAR
jgi:hypothetical protein